MQYEICSNCFNSATYTSIEIINSPYCKLKQLGGEGAYWRLDIGKLGGFEYVFI